MLLYVISKKVKKNEKKSLCLQVKYNISVLLLKIYSLKANISQNIIK